MGRKIVGGIGSRPQASGCDALSCKSAFGSFIVSKRYSGCREKTIETYQNHIVEFVSWCDDLHLGIGDITRTHGERWEGLLRLDRCNRDTTVQTKIRSIRTFLYWCMDEERNWLKPFRVNLPKADMVLKTPYTKGELDVLLACPKNDDLSEWRNWAAISFIVRTGVRLSSAVNLRWADIDFEGHVCKLTHTKTNEQYFVPIPSDALVDMMTWHKISPATRLGYVFFSTYTENKLKPNGLYQAIRKYNLSRGVEKTSVHLLRHTYATIYLQRGGRAERLQKILGHNAAKMTQRYVHLVTDDLLDGIDEFTV